MKIALISDLHAHSIRKDKPNASTIIFDSIVTKPVSQNPLKSLPVLIDKLKLNADLLLLPGDFCDKSDIPAFGYVWNELKNIAGKLGVKDVLATIGNHDVIRGDQHPFQIVTGHCLKEFPVQQVTSENDLFWSHGACLVPYPELDSDVLILNSSFHHSIESEVKNGKVDDDQLLFIAGLLENNLKHRFRLALFHHHPIAHERMGSSTFDLMVNGSELMELLDKFDFTIAVHGHKHDPRLRYSNSGPGSTAVFASGSFSCVPDLMLPGAYNTFHIVSLDDKKVEHCEKQGVIETYNFISGKGWVVNNTPYLPSVCGFGCTLTPAQLAENTFEILKANTWNPSSKKYNPMMWDDFLTHMPALNYLIQTSFEAYGRICKQKYKIEFSTTLPQRPEVIFLNQ